MLANQRGAALVEFALSMLLLGGILTSALYYTWQYLATDEKAMVAKSLELGRLNVIPPLLVRANARDVVPLPEDEIAARLQQYIQRSFVIKTGAALASGCKGEGDFRAFMDVLNCTASGRRCALDNHGNGDKGTEFDCEGNILDASEDRIPLHIIEAAENFGALTRRDKRHIVVIYSRTHSDLGAIVFSADDTPLFPTTTYGYIGY